MHGESRFPSLLVPAFLTSLQAYRDSVRARSQASLTELVMGFVSALLEDLTDLARGSERIRK